MGFGYFEIDGILEIAIEQYELHIDLWDHRLTVVLGLVFV